MSENKFSIRQATLDDLDVILDIYAYARQFMVEHGNPKQWADSNWPSLELVKKDIASGNDYVCEYEGRVVGVFYYAVEVDPTYISMAVGEWKDDSDYGVVHRIASDGSVRGVGEYCINWAYDLCHHLRIDTHGDNKVMQNLLVKLGFEHCGTIYIERDNDPRLAYEKYEASNSPTVSILTH